MGILDWIQVGKLSAERDDLLSQYFFDNGVLQRVIGSPSSFLVLGRKGAGKTAVFKFLSDNPDRFLESNDILVPLSFEAYNWNIHGLLQNRHAAESLAYKNSWRFVIYVETLKAYERWHRAKGIDLPPLAANALKVLRKIFDSPIPSVYDLVGKKLLGLSKLKLPKAGLTAEDGSFDGLEINAGEVAFDTVAEDKTLLEALSNNISNLIDYFERAIDSVNVAPRVFICFDRVDEAWDKTSVGVSSRVIAGLITAADSITAKYKGLLRPVIFLREDIFEVLDINDLNKLREDCGALLHWDRESLFKLVLMRINYFAQQNGQSPIKDIDSLFDKKEMRQRSKPSRYLLRRTMMRPRDLISLLGRTIESMRETQNDPFAEGDQLPTEYLATESIYAAEAGYSDWLYNEIVDEWGVQRPEIKALLNALRGHGSTNISSSELEREYGRQSLLSEEKTKIDQYTRFLYDNSVIGFKIGQGADWKFKCFQPSQGFVDSDTYHVHDGLIRTLNLKEPRERDDA